MLLAAIAPAVDSNRFNTSMEYDTSTHAWHPGIFRGDFRGRRNTWGVCLVNFGSPATNKQVAEMLSGIRGAYEDLATAYAPDATEEGQSDNYRRRPLPPGHMGTSLLAYDPETDCACVWCIDEWYDLPEPPNLAEYSLAGECDGWQIYYITKWGSINFDSSIPQLVHMSLLQLCSWDTPSYAALAAVSQVPAGCRRAMD